ncbi:30S ribosomal protein S14 [Candidatus Woesearchaeota archaeon]|nr:30S ribosomal protein S14 [Candidatus Woesearchaeota archaeon]
MKKYIRFNAPKERTTGIAKNRCRRCGRIRGHISKYGLHYCRQCFREIATRLGFKKYY